MQEENEEPTTTTDPEAKPTITIAEKQGGAAAATAEEKPTITIAEKDGGE